MQTGTGFVRRSRVVGQFARGSCADAARRDDVSVAYPARFAGDVQMAAALTTIPSMNDTLRRLVPVAAVFAASPAFACGGPRLNSAQMGVLMLSMATAPMLAALLVDRGAFALGAHAVDLERKHKPSIVGPLLAMIAVAVSLTGASMGALGLATVGFTLIPVATVICGLSFMRSVIIDQRGNRRAQTLRVLAVVGFSALALARVAL